MESMTLPTRSRVAGESGRHVGSGPGRRLQTDIINQRSVTGRSNKMADGSAGAKMAAEARMTKK